MADVLMRHPETGGVAKTSRHAFEGLWAGKGWVEVTDVTAAEELQAQAAHEQEVRRVTGGRTVEDLKDATKAVLTEVAGQLGQTVDPKASKAELQEQVLHPQKDDNPEG